MIGAMARKMTSPVLVGRTEVLEQLQAAMASARTGTPQHVVIGGEAGVGKTRLLARTRELAEGQGSRVLIGGCVSMGDAGLPFAPYTEILRSLVAQDGAATVAALAGRAAADLSRLVPALSPDEAPPEQEQWAQARLYEALLDLFGRLAERAPLVLQLEDMHWADAGTLAATSYLLRAAHGAPITIVATFRTDEVTRKHPLRPWLAEVARDADVERIDLEPLETTELAELVHNIIGEDLPLREFDEIRRRSDGNPFFAEELLCCRTEIDVSLPTSLREVLLSRIDTLPDSTQHLIGVAAVGGREVEHDILMSVAGDDAGASAPDLRRLVDEGLLVTTRAIDGDDAYSFRHALLQEAVYDSMLPTERRRLHCDWGEFLSSHKHDAGAGAAYLVLLAHHWREARDARALAASIEAGDAAIASYSYGIASGEYEEALLLWDDSSETAGGIDHVELLERTSRAAYLSSQHRRAVAASREAIDELGSTDSARLTMLLISLGRALWVFGDWGLSIEAYEEALRIAPAEPPLVRARALAGLGQVYMLHARMREARPLCEEAIEAARAIGARDLEGHGLNSLGVVLSGLGETVAANESINEALGIAVELGIPDDIGRAYVNRAEVESWSGYPERAVETSIEGVAECARWGVASSYGATIGFGAVSFAFEAGQWDQAAKMLAEADRGASNDEGTFAYSASYLMEFFACSGDPRFAATWERAARLMLDRPASDNHGLITQGGIENASFAGRFDEALEVAWDGIKTIGEPAGRFRLGELARVAAWPLAEVGRAARAAGDADAVREASRDMDQLMGLATAWQQTIQQPGDRLRRVLELNAAQVDAERARMEDSDAARTWATLSEGWAEVGRPFRVAMARWREAEAAEAAGDRKAAVVALREAHRIASELGAKPLLGNLEVMARRMRTRLGGSVRPETSSAGPAYGLTRREREVLEQVAAGRTNRQIAEELFISESTAGVHVSNILGKLGVSTRTEAARVALDQGLIDS